MWDVFAVHLRSAWTSLAATPATKEMEVDGVEGQGAEENDAAAAGSREEVLLARELDGDLFVLFLRNLHVTSSVAAGVGVLCSRLAEEVSKLVFISQSWFGVTFFVAAFGSVIHTKCTAGV